MYVTMNRCGHLYTNILSTLYTNQLSLTVTVSLTHQQITLLQFSNRRSFNFHLTYAW